MFFESIPLIMTLAVHSRAVGGEPDTPPAGRAGPAGKAAAAEGGQVRGTFVLGYFIPMYFKW